MSYPTNTSEAEIRMIEFTKAGMNGAFGSVDAAHVVVKIFLYWLKQNHQGGKSQHIYLSFNITTNRRRQILRIAPGHSARWNDKK